MCSSFVRTFPNRWLRGRCRAVSSRPGLAFSFTAQVTPTPSAAALPLFAGITLVAVYRPIVLADQAVHHLGVVHVPGVTAAVCTRPLSASTPTCAFMPKYH
jgi:hypothetical protein